MVLEKPMKKIIHLLLVFSLLTSSTTLLADHCNCLEAANDEMNAAYLTGCGCEDGIYNAVSNSMLIWGIVLAVGIGLIAGFHNQSATAHVPATTTSSSSTTSSP